MKLVEQVTLVTLQTAHHGSTPPRFASSQRNHASARVSTVFCNKIGQFQTRLGLLIRQSALPLSKLNCVGVIAPMLLRGRLLGGAGLIQALPKPEGVEAGQVQERQEGRDEQ